MKGILSLFLFFSLLVTSKGQTIRAIGGWNNSISANTITTAGNDYSLNVISGINQTSLDISPTAINWIVRINKIDNHWHNSLELYAKRTGNGLILATATISGGAIFSVIQNTSTEFFRGTISITSIPIQYEIKGLSVLIPAGNYSTTIYYTISDY